MSKYTDYQNASYDGRSYFETVTDAVSDIADFGFDSIERLETWATRIRDAADRTLSTPDELVKDLSRRLESDYDKIVTKEGIKKTHAGVSSFTIERLKPELRAELDRRVMASAQLIKLNREEAIQKTVRRLSGWATSIPPGGVMAESKNEVKNDIKKSIKQLPFEERRVIIDQSHKLFSAINNIVAEDAGAIAVRWHSHWKEQGYKFRVQHKMRDGHIFLLKRSWAKDKGFVKANKDGYYEDIDGFGQEPFCRCYGSYIYDIEDLPEDMITEKGREALKAIGDL